MSDTSAVQGAATVTVGQLLQHTSHFILARLPSAALTRGGPRGAEPGAAAHAAARASAAAPCAPSAAAAARPTASYALPRGGGFEWVSCPHYLGEIVIYAGLAVASEFRGLSLLVLAWVVRTPPLPADGTRLG